MARIAGLGWSCWPPASDRLLVRAALHEDDDTARRAWVAARAHLDLDRLSDEQYRLLPLLAQRLATTAPTDALLGRLAGVARRTAVQNLLLLRAATSPVAVLRAGGIDPILLKGPALALTAYPRVGLRPFVDVDLLVAPGVVAAARGRLEAAGWTLAAADFPGNHALTLEGGAIGVDLHRHLSRELTVTGPDPYDPHRLTTVTTTRALPGGVRIRTLTPGGHLVHAVVHGTQLVGPVTTRWLADVAMLQRAGNIDWDEVVDLADRWSVGPVLHDGLRLAGQLTGTAAPDAALGHLRRQRVRTFERIRHAAFRTRPATTGILGGLPLTLSVHLQRTHHLGPLGVVRTLPAFLADAWELDRLTELPAAALRRAAGQPGREPGQPGREPWRDGRVRARRQYD